MTNEERREILGKRKSVKLFTDQLYAASKMPADDFKQYMMAVLDFLTSEQEPEELDLMAEMLFISTRGAMEKANDSYIKQATQGDKGINGGRPARQRVKQNNPKNCAGNPKGSADIPKDCTDNPKGLGDIPKGLDNNPKGLNEKPHTVTVTDTVTATDTAAAAARTREAAAAENPPAETGTPPFQPINAEAVISLPLDDGSCYDITQSDVDAYSEQFQEIDVMEALGKYQRWLMDRPQRLPGAYSMPDRIKKWLSDERPRVRGDTHENDNRGTAFVPSTGFRSPDELLRPAGDNANPG